MTRRITLFGAALLLACLVTGDGAAAQAAAETLKIIPVVHDDEVSVSFELADAYNEDVRAAIGSGLRTTFTYDVELKMSVAAWFNRTIAAVVVTNSDQYDNLTRRHTMTRMIDGRIVDTLTTDDDVVVRKWLTTVSRMPLCKTSKLDANREYYVQISARARPNRGSLLGWVSTVQGEAKFTFVP